MWLESTTAPATVSDDEFLLLPLCIYTGEGKNEDDSQVRRPA